MECQKACKENKYYVCIGKSFVQLIDILLSIASGSKIKHTAGSCFALSNKLSYEKDKQEIAHKNSRLINNSNEYKLAEVE